MVAEGEKLVIMQLKEFCNLSHNFYGLFLSILQTNGLTIGRINEKEQ